jgi:hypothetical protein
MPSLARELLVLLGWLALAALVVVVFGLIVVPAIWSLGRGGP